MIFRLAGSGFRAADLQGGDEKKPLMTLMTLKALEKQLPYDRFCRTHRSWIVNVDKVRGIRLLKVASRRERSLWGSELRR